MKFKYDNEIIEGNDPDELVTKLRESSKFGEADNQAYMVGFASRQLEYDGYLPRTDSSLEFLKSLVIHKVLVKVD